jgi:hypothetical protein
MFLLLKQKIVGCQWLMPIILVTWEAEAESERITISPDQTLSKIPKKTRPTCSGGLTQAVKSLLCKSKALSSNPNPTKK